MHIKHNIQNQMGSIRTAWLYTVVPALMGPRPGNPFGPGNAIDGDETTFWMPAQVPKAGEPNYITLDMTCPRALGATGKAVGDQNQQ